MHKRLVSIAVAGSLLGFFGSGLTSGAQACPASQWQPNPPAGWHTADRTIGDGQTTAGSSTLTSPADAQFNSYDKGRAVTGTNIPANTTIFRFQSPTVVILSAKATATGSGLSVTIAGKAWQNPSTAVAASPDGGTVVYTNNGFSPTRITGNWVGVNSTSASTAGIDGHTELNTGTPDSPGGYFVVAGDSPAGGGGVMTPIAQSITC